ncbi:hypothetical protein E2C01_059851 [Portunus trituberculatus]|uniref:Uncharacterized protein n=1 Tax=Portunus trituberculatus TaxID=210409 RepID=A0A5B7H7R6_PORTR|nr:hypothetical protein [Portunus trituberculatus]
MVFSFRQAHPLQPPFLPPLPCRPRHRRHLTETTTRQSCSLLPLNPGRLMCPPRNAHSLLERVRLGGRRRGKECQWRRLKDAMAVFETTQSQYTRP